VSARRCTRLVDSACILGLRRHRERGTQIEIERGVDERPWANA
jgi:hypothetical protein